MWNYKNNNHIVLKKDFKVDKFVLQSVEIPPIRLRIYVLDFVSAKIELTYINFETIFPEKFKDNVTINIIVTKNCINSKEKKERIQFLKNQLDEFKE